MRDTLGLFRLENLGNMPATIRIKSPIYITSFGIKLPTRCKWMLHVTLDI